MDKISNFALSSTVVQQAHCFRDIDYYRPMPKKIDRRPEGGGHRSMSTPLNMPLVIGQYDVRRLWRVGFLSAAARDPMWAHTILIPIPCPTLRSLFVWERTCWDLLLSHRSKAQCLCELHKMHSVLIALCREVLQMLHVHVRIWQMRCMLNNGSASSILQTVGLLSRGTSNNPQRYSMLLNVDWAIYSHDSLV